MQKLKGCYRQISRQVVRKSPSQLSYRKYQLKTLTVSLLLGLVVFFYLKLRITDEVSRAEKHLVVHAVKPYKSLQLSRHRQDRFLRRDNKPAVLKTPPIKHKVIFLRKKLPTKVNITTAFSSSTKQLDQEHQKLQNVPPLLKHLDLKPMNKSKVAQRHSSSVKQSLVLKEAGGTAVFKIHSPQNLTKKAAESVLYVGKQSVDEQYNNKTKQIPKSLPMNSTFVSINVSKI